MNIAVPYLFGRGVRERVLAAVAASGPVHLSAISKHLGVANDSVWRAAKHLGKCGDVLIILGRRMAHKHIDRDFYVCSDATVYGQRYRRITI
jgi:hypothetical protein